MRRSPFGPAKPCHVGFRPGLIEEDETPGVDEPLIAPPARSMAAYVPTILLARNERLFLNVTPILEETAHHRGLGFDASLGPKAITESLKRDIRLLSPRRLENSRCGMSLEAR